jgi:hypothetical protein
MTKTLDKFDPVVYYSAMVKRALFLLVALAFLVSPSAVLADDEVVICPQPYGGGVVCGIKHEPVETGIADSLPLIGSGFVGASALMAYLTRKFKKSA